MNRNAGPALQVATDSVVLSKQGEKNNNLKKGEKMISDEKN